MLPSTPLNGKQQLKPFCSLVLQQPVVTEAGKTTLSGGLALKDEPLADPAMAVQGIPCPEHTLLLLLL